MHLQSLPIAFNTVIRDARSEDAEAIGVLHARVWYETYQYLAPAEALAQLDASRRAAGWRTVLNDDFAKTEVMVIVTDGDIIGFTAIGPGEHHIYGDRGEIKQLYVDQAYQGEGLGERLMRSAAARLATRGFSSCALAVVEGNDRAKAFYKRLGGVDDGGFTDTGPLWKSRNRLMVWRDIASLF